MRKHTPVKGSVLSMASINSPLYNSALYQRTRSSSHYRNGALEDIAGLRQQMGKQPLVQFKFKKKQPLNRSEIVEANKSLFSRELKKAHEEIAQIKNEIKRQRSFTDGTREDKLDRFIYLLRDSVSLKPSQPIYYPIPMPVPYLMQNQHSLPAI